MATLKELVEEHGFGIKVDALGYMPFTVISEGPDDRTFLVELQDGTRNPVLKEHPYAADYKLVDAPVNNGVDEDDGPEWWVLEALSDEDTSEHNRINEVSAAAQFNCVGLVSETAGGVVAYGLPAIMEACAKALNREGHK